MYSIKVTLDTQLTWKDGLWYGALISSKHKISAELLTDVPFTGAELRLIQAQEVSSSIFSFGFDRVTCKQSYIVQPCELKFVSVRRINVCLQDTNSLGNCLHVH